MTVVLKNIINLTFRATIFITIFVVFYFLFRELWEIILIEKIEERPFSIIGLCVIFLFLIYKSYSNTKTIRIKPETLFGTSFLVISLTILHISKVSGIITLEYIALFIAVIGILLFLFGRGVLGIFLGPIIFFITIFGIDAYISELYVHEFQMITTLLSNFILNILGIMTLNNGYYLYLPHITLLIEPSCNGLNQIVTLIIIAFILGWKLPRWKKALVIIFTFLMGLFLNALRITFIGIWGIAFEGDLLHGPANIFYVSFIFIFGTIILVVLIEKLALKEPTIKLRINIFSELLNTRVKEGITLLGILLVGVIVLQFLEPKEYALKNKTLIIPEKIEEWNVTNKKAIPYIYKINSPDTEVVLSFENQKGETLTVYIAYLNKQTQNREVVNYYNTRLHKISKAITINLFSNSNIYVNEAEYTQDELAGKIWFWYYIDDQVIPDPLRAKYLTLKDAILNRKSNGAFIMITSTSESTIRSGSANKFLQKFISELSCIIQVEDDKT